MESAALAATDNCITLMMVPAFHGAVLLSNGILRQENVFAEQDLSVSKADVEIVMKIKFTTPLNLLVSQDVEETNILSMENANV